MHGFRGKAVFIDNADMLQHIFDFRNTRFQFALVRLSFVIFAVFGKVAERFRFLDFLGNIRPAGGAQLFQLRLELLQTGLG